MMSIVVVTAAVFGLAIGSFLNVVIWRVPRGESVVRPRSHCPDCGTAIAPRDEVPVLSWVLLRGRCRACGVRFGARYPLVELTCGLLFAAMAARFPWPGSGAESIRSLPAFLYLAGVGLALAVIDIDTKRLPNSLTLPSYPISLALLSVASLTGAGLRPLLQALAGAAAMYAVYFILWFAAPGGMGFGDVKLAGVLGGYLGWLGWSILAVGLLGGWILGGIIGIALMLTGRAGRKTKIPLGPFMIAGAFLAIFAGHAIARLWLRG